MNDADTGPFDVDFFQRVAQRLHAAVGVGFDDDVQFFDLAFLQLFVQVVQCHFAGGRQFFLPLLGSPTFSDLSCFFLILKDDGTDPPHWARR